jgi:hypothetical protein
MQSRVADWSLVALVPLALLAGCAKAQFVTDAGTGGSGGDGVGGDSSGTGGTVASDGGTGGEEIDAPINDDGLSDAGMEDTAPDGETDTPMVVDGSADLDDGDAATDGLPSGMMPNALGQILISELMYDSAAVADDFGEWFEIFNPSQDVTFNLLGCGISDHSPGHTQIIGKPVLVPPQSYRTFALSAPGGPAGTDPGFTPDYVYAGIKFDNDLQDSVTFTCGVVVIDVFQYVPANPPAPGHTLSVDPTHLNYAEHDLPANYCRAQMTFHTTGSGTDYGTPGMPNPSCPTQ